YPLLSIGVDGRLFVAWTSESSGFFSSYTQSYYDVRFVYTDDGGTTFYGPSSANTGASQRTFPLAADGSIGGQTQQGYFIPDEGNPLAFIPGSDPNYGNGTGQKYNWNHAQTMAFNHNALHFFYQAESNDPHVVS